MSRPQETRTLLSRADGNFLISWTISLEKLEFSARCQQKIYRKYWKLYILPLPISKLISSGEQLILAASIESNKKNRCTCDRNFNQIIFDWF